MNLETYFKIRVLKFFFKKKGEEVNNKIKD